MKDPQTHSHKIIVGKQSKPHNFKIQHVPLELLAHLCNDVMHHTGNPIDRFDAPLSHLGSYETFEGSQCRKLSVFMGLEEVTPPPKHSYDGIP